MIRSSIVEKLIIIGKNYRSLVTALFYFSTFFLFISAVSLIITFPIWYAATNYSTVYSVVVILIVVVTALLISADRLKKWIDIKKKSGRSNKSIILIPVRIAAVYILFFSFLYLIIFLFSQNYFLPAVFLSIIYMLILGYYFFILSQNNANTDS